MMIRMVHHLLQQFAEHIIQMDIKKPEENYQRVYQHKIAQ